MHVEREETETQRGGVGEGGEGGGMCVLTGLTWLAEVSWQLLPASQCDSHNHADCVHISQGAAL